METKSRRENREANSIIKKMKKKKKKKFSIICLFTSSMKFCWTIAKKKKSTICTYLNPLSLPQRCNYAMLTPKHKHLVILKNPNKENASFSICLPTFSFRIGNVNRLKASLTSFYGKNERYSVLGHTFSNILIPEMFPIQMVVHYSNMKWRELEKAPHFHLSCAVIFQLIFFSPFKDWILKFLDMVFMMILWFYKKMQLFSSFFPSRFYNTANNGHALFLHLFIFVFLCCCCFWFFLLHNWNVTILFFINFSPSHEKRECHSI